MKSAYMKLIILIGFAFFTTALYAEENTDLKQPAAFLPKASYEFEPVPEGKKIIHDFILQNKGNAPLTINKIRTG